MTLKVSPKNHEINLQVHMSKTKKAIYKNYQTMQSCKEELHRLKSSSLDSIDLVLLQIIDETKTWYKRLGIALEARKWNNKLHTSK